MKKFIIIIGLLTFVIANSCYAGRFCPNARLNVNIYNKSQQPLTLLTSYCRGGHFIKNEKPSTGQIIEPNHHFSGQLRTTFFSVPNCTFTMSLPTKSRTAILKVKTYISNLWTCKAKESATWIYPKSQKENIYHQKAVISPYDGETEKAAIKVEIS